MPSIAPAARASPLAVRMAILCTRTLHHELPQLRRFLQSTPQTPSYWARHLLHRCNSSRPPLALPQQYCDRACALGGCCLARCHNAAHLWALGWADPVEGGSLVLEGLTEGLTLPYRLPAQHSSDASFVMIDASPGVVRLAQACVKEHKENVAQRQACVCVWAQALTVHALTVMDG